ncbi:hypothetical protein [Vulcanisaeta distributa]|uniref:hypothetical protein n=1 Tax=Vulcanisaeta distributa TaxID=164451 RepID=UPI0006CFC190|nr:hypothetical protein [Vulcanisaeta distributa]
MYGTKVILHLPCSGVIYGRYLISNGDYIEGLYVVINDMECGIVVSWYEEGINTEMQVRSNEALLIIIKLMRLRSRKVRPDGHALRIMRVLNLSGKLLYSDANHEVQIFGVEKGFVPQSQGNCAYDFVIKQWRLILNKCGFMTEVLTNTDSIVLLISGTDSIIITRHYPSLNKWYELGEVSGFNNYLVIFKGLDSSAL